MSETSTCELCGSLVTFNADSETTRFYVPVASPVRLAAVRAEVKWAREHASYLELGSDDPDQDRDNIATRDIIEAALARALVTLDTLLAAPQ